MLIEGYNAAAGEGIALCGIFSELHLYQAKHLLIVDEVVPSLIVYPIRETLLYRCCIYVHLSM
jgi:hypothetical protein